MLPCLKLRLNVSQCFPKRYLGWIKENGSPQALFRTAEFPGKDSPLRSLPLNICLGNVGLAGRRL